MNYGKSAPHLHFQQAEEVKPKWKYTVRRTWKWSSWCLHNMKNWWKTSSRKMQYMQNVEIYIPFLQAVEMLVNHHIWIQSLSGENRESIIHVMHTVKNLMHENVLPVLAVCSAKELQLTCFAYCAKCFGWLISKASSVHATLGLWIWCSVIPWLDARAYFQVYSKVHSKSRWLKLVDKEGYGIADHYISCKNLATPK